MLSSTRAFDLLFGDKSLHGASVLVLAILSLFMDNIEALQNTRFRLALPIIGADPDEVGQTLVVIHLPDQEYAHHLSSANREGHLTFVTGQMEAGDRRIFGSVGGRPCVQIRVEDDRLLVQFL